MLAFSYINSPSDMIHLKMVRIWTLFNLVLFWIAFIHMWIWISAPFVCECLESIWTCLHVGLWICFITCLSLLICVHIFVWRWVLQMCTRLYMFALNTPVHIRVFINTILICICTYNCDFKWTLLLYLCTCT